VEDERGFYTRRPMGRRGTPAIHGGSGGSCKHRQPGRRNLAYEVARTKDQRLPPSELGTPIIFSKSPSLRSISCLSIDFRFIASTGIGIRS